MCDGYDPETHECVEYISCELACEREPHAYPVADCVSGLAAGLGCEAIVEACGR